MVKKDHQGDMYVWEQHGGQRAMSALRLQIGDENVTRTVCLYGPTLRQRLKLLQMSLRLSLESPLLFLFLWLREYVSALAGVVRGWDDG